ncbi:phage tail terminator protein [Rheinheimera baltica]|uniref:phage tail terminator protein n=1 Tax=Rheinheimera baltica TaxID=67576 RepID=UPI0004141DC6|nr:hypothetical protein [Rheinheimera baltica]
MLDIAEDYLATEQHLEAVLKNIEGLRKVYCSADMAEVTDKTQATPCAHVIYMGDKVPESVQAGSLIHVTQTWLVVLAVRLSPDSSKEAGKLLARTLRGIQQNSFVQGIGPLNRVNAPARPLLKSGFGYYPLAFEVRFRVK